MVLWSTARRPLHVCTLFNRTTLCILGMLVGSLWSAVAKEQSELEGLVSRPKHCSYVRSSDMYGADCADLGLSKLPSLKGGIEILDFSKNKLKYIQSDTLSKYTSIKILYLSENYIRHIEDDAFMYLTDLQSLDLSTNSITKLPDPIFQLPSLRKLYLSGNPLSYLNSDYEGLSKPIKAPLEHLDISDCEIPGIPNLGVLPQLIIYNISMNPLLSMKVQFFVQACRLTEVDLTGATDKIRLCDLSPTITWFKDKHIYFKLEDYSRLNTKEFQNCPQVQIPEAMNVTYNYCKSQYVQPANPMRSSQRSMITVVGGLAGFLVGFILLLYLTHLCNVAKLKRTEKKTAPVCEGEKQATAILLHNVS